MAARKVVGIEYKDRKSGEQFTITLEGIFVQIGLLPNTDWLKGAIALTDHGEIEIDSHGQTSVAGVFAASDCTTSPYKKSLSPWAQAQPPHSAHSIT